MSNHVLLERIELNATTASVTFANIPQTGYTDLKVVASTRDTNATSNNGLFAITLNGSTTYTSARNVSGNGASASSGTGDIFVGGGDTVGNTANTFSNVEVYFPNYTSTAQKSISADAVSEQNGTTAYMALTAQLFNLTTAITSISIAGRSGFAQYSTFSLYGVAATGTTPSIAPKASGGNTITTDGNYWYHAFLTSGTFTPIVSLTSDVLVIAGGGGGGYSISGGGGAGGLLGFNSQSLAATGYTVTIGSGGAGSGSTRGVNGSDSQFGALTLVKGGGGGGSYAGTGPGATGGSGGGGGSISQTGGSATSGQGFAGGNGGSTSTFYVAGGGGGSGAVGSNGNGAVGGGAGGVGSSAYSSWGLATTTGQNVSGTVFFAGGGGGGGYRDSGGGQPTQALGGNGGGGNATAGSQSGNTPGTNGTTNTGGGGGGGNFGNYSNAAGYNGGSGIVIVRYAV